jgi:hypothetical protein
MGVDMADAANASPSNQRGHWERPRVNDLNDEVFAMFGRSWSSAAHVLSLPPHWLDDPRVHRVRAALIEYVSQCVAAAPGTHWGLKDPRITRLLPLWRQVFAAIDATPRFVFCVRDPAQVARSLNARDRLAREQAEYRWLVYHTDAVAGIGNDAVCVVPYEDWFTGNSDPASRLACWAGVPPLPAAGRAAILDPALRHDAAESSTAKPLARRLYLLLARSENAGHFGADLRNLCLCLGEFEQQVQPLLVETEILRVSVTDQNRVIGDLNEAIRRLRHAMPKAKEGLVA